MREIKNFLTNYIFAKNFYKNYFVYLLELYLKKLIKGRFRIYYIYKLKNNIKLSVRLFTWDSWIIDEIFFRKIYNPEGFEIKDSDIVIDVGAHIGSFTIYAAINTKEGQIFSFEPVKENYFLLKKNIELNGIKNVYIHNLSITDKTGKDYIHISDNNTGICSHILKGSKTKKEIVNTTTLTSIIKNYKLKKIDFLKIDAEGSEYDILRSLPGSIIKKILKIVIEYHYVNEEKNINTLIEFFKENGYEYHFTKNPDIIYAKRLTVLK